MTTKRRADIDIQRDVLDELQHDGRLRQTDVGVLVHQAVVTLTGNVPTFAMKAAAQEVAHRVAGVLDVVDDIAVHIVGIGAPDDTTIAHEVRTALEAIDGLPHRQVHTTVSHGVVTLKGHVFTAAQRDAVSIAVRHVRGTAGVLNQLDVTSPRVTEEDVRVAVLTALQRQDAREVNQLEVELANGQVILRGIVHSWTERRAIVGAVRGLAGIDDVVDELAVVESVRLVG